MVFALWDLFGVITQRYEDAKQYLYRDLHTSYKVVRGSQVRTYDLWHLLKERMGTLFCSGSSSFTCFRWFRVGRDRSRCGRRTLSHAGSNLAQSTLNWPFFMVTWLFLKIGSAALPPVPCNGQCRYLHCEGQTMGTLSSLFPQGSGCQVPFLGC
jgi:hypothetical protein